MVIIEVREEGQMAWEAVGPIRRYKAADEVAE
jgi:hypothetical protein